MSALLIDKKGINLLTRGEKDPVVSTKGLQLNGEAVKVRRFVMEVQISCRGKTGLGDCEVEGIQSTLQHF